MRSLGPRGWVLPALAVLVSYNTWLLWAPLNGHVRILDGYLSELSAGDQPRHLVFRGGDLITGLLVGPMAVAWLRQRLAAGGSGRRWGVLSAAGLAVFAICTILDSLFPMDCAPTLSDACRAAEDAGRLSPAHVIHTGTSVGAQLGIVVSLIAGALASRSAVVVTLAVIEVLALTTMMIMLLSGSPGLGYPQMIMVAGASVWCAAVGLHLAGVARLGGDHDAGR